MKLLWRRFFLFGDGVSDSGMIGRLIYCPHARSRLIKINKVNKVVFV